MSFFPGRADSTTNGMIGQAGGRAVGRGDFDNVHCQASLHAGCRFKYNFSCATSQQVDGDSCTRDRVERLLFETLFKRRIMAGRSEVNRVIPR